MSDKGLMLKNRNISPWFVLYIKSSSEGAVFFIFIHFHIYIYIYIYVCVCVCVCVRVCMQCVYFICNYIYTFHTHTDTHTYIYICINIYVYFKINWSTKRFLSFKNYLFRSYIRICFQLIAYLREQGHVNGAPNETGTYLYRFVSRIY